MEYFINLTAGIEQIKEWECLPFQFIRIQSTHLERKQFDLVIRDLDNNLLMKLAMGKKCCVFDMTSRKKKNNTSRACWQGIPWIEYCLNRVWFKKETKYEYGLHVCFQEKFKELSSISIRKLKYYRKFLLTDKITLGYICDPTDNDGNDQFYLEMIKKYKKFL